MTTKPLDREVDEIINLIYARYVPVNSHANRNRAKQSILSLIQQWSMVSIREVVRELEKAHRAGGTRPKYNAKTGYDPNYDNDTDEYIDNRIDQLETKLKSMLGEIE